jgi:hypothetical protein
MQTNTHFCSYLAQFFVEWDMFQTNKKVKNKKKYFQTEVVEKIKRHILFSVTFFPISCRLWDKVEKYCRAGQATKTIWGMRIACWVTKATDTHSEYAILIAFPLQQLLHERASMLRYTRIACFVIVYINPIRQRQWKWESCFIPVLLFPQSVSFYQCSVLICTAIVLLSEVQAGERTWER